MYNNGMYSNYEVDKEMVSETKTESSHSSNMNMTMQGQMTTMPGIVMPPVYECPKERVFHREIMHEVPHICPVNTRIINHHIYRHTYSPCYTCQEENECSNVYDECCNNF